MIRVTHGNEKEKKVSGRVVSEITRCKIFCTNPRFYCHIQEDSTKIRHYWKRYLYATQMLVTYNQKVHRNRSKKKGLTIERLKRKERHKNVIYSDDWVYFHWNSNRNTYTDPPLATGTTFIGNQVPIHDTENVILSRHREIGRNNGQNCKSIE